MLSASAKDNDLLTVGVEFRGPTDNVCGLLKNSLQLNFHEVRLNEAARNILGVSSANRKLESKPITSGFPVIERPPFYQQSVMSAKG